MKTFRGECIGKRVSVTCAKPYKDESPSYEEALDGSVDHRFRLPTVGWARGPFPIHRESPEPIFDPDEQSETENEREFERYSEGDAEIRSLGRSPNTVVDWEKSAPDPTLETTRGVNKRGNEWESGRCPNNDAHRYKYNNKDGSQYAKHCDGTARFDDPHRGITKHYPAPIPDEQIRHEEHDRGEGRDVSPRYPSTSQGLSTSQRSKAKHRS